MVRFGRRCGDQASAEKHHVARRNEPNLAGSKAQVGLAWGAERVQKCAVAKVQAVCLAAHLGSARNDKQPNSRRQAVGGTESGPHAYDVNEAAGFDVSCWWEWAGGL